MYPVNRGRFIYRLDPLFVYRGFVLAEQLRAMVNDVATQAAPQCPNLVYAGTVEACSHWGSRSCW